MLKSVIQSIANEEVMWIQREGRHRNTQNRALASRRAAAGIAVTIFKKLLVLDTFENYMLVFLVS